MRFNTALLHAGVKRDEVNGATHTPIYQSSAFHHASSDELAKIFDNKAKGFSYTRVGNPTIEAFEARITQLEGGASTIACASGMAALTNAILNIVRSGEEIVSSASLYGGSIDLFRDFENLGITTRYIQNNDFDALESAINDKTRAVFAETIGNPKLDVTDIKKTAEIAHKHGLPLIVDNTVATAFLVKPIELGADIVINSSSKYINGSSNAISGVLTDACKFKWDTQKYPQLAQYKKFGPFAYSAKLRNGLFRNTGACLAPQNAFLNMVGLETLGLRMERQCDNAYKLARWLDENFDDITVNYPGLESSPWHAIAKEQLREGYYGAILTLRTGSKERAFKVIDSLKLPYKISNIGDTKTLVIHPASTIALHNTVQELADAGVYDDLIRVSVGIEDFEDLKEDFNNALQ